MAIQDIDEAAAYISARIRRDGFGASPLETVNGQTFVRILSPQGSYIGVVFLPTDLSAYDDDSCRTLLESVTLDAFRACLNEPVLRGENV